MCVPDGFFKERVFLQVLTLGLQPMRFRTGLSSASNAREGLAHKKVPLWSRINMTSINMHLDSDQVVPYQSDTPPPGFFRTLDALETLWNQLFRTVGGMTGSSSDSVQSQPQACQGVTDML